MDKLETYDKKKGIDFTGVSISFICHDGKGNILLHKRSQNCRDEQGNWDTGAGSLELGHTVEDTIKREIKEEYCTEPLNYEFIGYSDMHREANGKKTHWIGLHFKAQVDPTKVKIGEPHKADSIGWFKLTSLPTPLHSQLPKILEKYGHKLNF